MFITSFSPHCTRCFLQATAVKVMKAEESQTVTLLSLNIIILTEDHEEDTVGLCLEFVPSLCRTYDITIAALPLYSVIALCAQLSSAV